MKEDFYLILPSNSCPLTQPDNNASLYVVDWQNPIELKGNWEAALTEFTYTFKPLHLDKLEIKYAKSFQLTSDLKNLQIVNDKKGKKVTNVTDSDFITITKSENDDDTFEFHIPNGESLNFKSSEDARMAGFLDQKNKIYSILINHIPPYHYVLNKRKIPFEVEFFETFNGVIPNNETKEFNTVSEICHHISSKTDIFETFLLGNDGFIHFKVQDSISSITFPDYLKLLFGFNTKTFDCKNNKSFTSHNKAAAQISKIEQLYIYSSLVEPILVGGTYVPLLRTIMLDDKIKTGDIRYFNIDRPMYLPVRSSSINNIEINIRDDFGRPINFPYGSKTILTLHLRKRNE